MESVVLLTATEDPPLDGAENPRSLICHIAVISAYRARCTGAAVRDPYGNAMMGSDASGQAAGILRRTLTY